MSSWSTFCARCRCGRKWFRPGTCSQVLRFLGYFREEVPNSPIETWRLRRVQFRWAALLLMGVTASAVAACGSLGTGAPCSCYGNPLHNPIHYRHRCQRFVHTSSRRYYLENDQVEIMELWEPNSGMPQVGCRALGASPEGSVRCPAGPIEQQAPVFPLAGTMSQLTEAHPPSVPQRAPFPQGILLKRHW